MQEVDFYQWLLKRYSKHTSDSRKANCSRIEKFEGDLDEHFNKDHCSGLLYKLSYSIDDERNSRPQKHNIPIQGDIRSGTATFRHAVIQYIDFRENKDDKNSTIGISVLNVKNRKTLKRETWPEWELPSDEEIYQLAQVATKYIRFISPDIVKLIVEDNSKHFSEWSNILMLRNVDPALYLWDKSPCCFPGIRRYAGSKEISSYTNHISLDVNDIKDAIKIDGNDFPKHIWSFIFRGKPFGKFGPKNYSLAHLIDHKKSNNRMEAELEFCNGEQYSKPIYGLFTSPANTIYIPNSLLKPTDFNLNLRNLLFRKAEELYSKSCNILPQYIKVPQNTDSKWSIDNFHWGDCVGTDTHIQQFLEYRSNIVDKYLNDK